MSQNLQSNATFTLSNGYQLPAVGLGTFQSDGDNSTVKNIVLAALLAGYRHIDTAAAYNNEKEVGQAIRESGIARADIFVTTKLAQTWHHPSDVAEALEQSLKNLQLDYVDLYLMHFPHAYAAGPNHSTIRHPSGNGKPMIDYQLSRAYPEVWRAMEALVDNGKAKSIGLSNFNILKTKRILEAARIRPVLNQVELHPYLPQHELFSFSKQEGIHLMAHQPLGGTPVSVVNPNAARPGPMLDPQIKEIASECRMSPAQVLLSWALQRGTASIPKTVRKDHLIENLQLRKLGEEQFTIIDSLASKVGTVRYLDPSGHIGFDIFNEIEDEPIADSALWDQ